jgi:hypothetical protein
MKRLLFICAFAFVSVSTPLYFLASARNNLVSITLINNTTRNITVNVSLGKMIHEPVTVKPAEDCIFNNYGPNEEDGASIEITDDKNIFEFRINKYFWENDTLTYLFNGKHIIAK